MGRRVRDLLANVVPLVRIGKRARVRVRLATFLALLLGPLVCVPAEQDDSVLRFGGEDAYAPMEWRNGSGGAGFNVDLARALSRELGMRAEHQFGTWPEMMSALDTGRIDVLPMFVSKSREQRLLFSAPFYYLHYQAYGNPDAKPLGDIAELRGKRVAIEANSVGAERLSTEIPQALAVVCASELEVMQSLASKQADYAIVTQLAGDRLNFERSYRFGRVSAPIWPVAYAFAVRPERTDLHRKVQQALALIHANGEYQAIFRKWEADLTPALRERRRLRWLTWALLTLGVCVGVLLIGQYSLRRLVRARTAALVEAFEQRNLAEEHLLRLSTMDVVTGLAQPRHLIERLNAQIDSHSTQGTNEVPPFEVQVIKTLDLESIVCSLGLAHAERLVLALADQLKATPDCTAAYLGRGVFAVQDTKQRGAELAQSLESRIACIEPDLLIRLAAGSAYWPVHGSDARQLMRRAEVALANSLKRKRSWSEFQATLEPDASSLAIVNAFKSGEWTGLHPVYQPQMRLADDRIVAAELLVRWDHPQLGQIDPSKLIPLLENTGLIQRLTEAMVEHALKTSVKLSALGIECTLSVNVSAYDLIELDFRQLILGLSSRLGARPEALHLELTESSLASDPERIRGSIARLSDIGVMVAIDDFGTGFSSLSYLSQFAVHELKVDRSFVATMRTQPRNHSIVRSTIALARELQMRITAEGVEHAADVEVLRADGCDLVQGHHIAPPMLEGDFLKLLQQR